MDMLVELIRKVHPQNAAWEIINDDVPLGKRYVVLRSGQVTLANPAFGREVVDAYLVRAADGQPAGWLPVFCFRVVES